MVGMGDIWHISFTLGFSVIQALAGHILQASSSEALVGFAVAACSRADDVRW